MHSCSTALFSNGACGSAGSATKVTIDENAPWEITINANEAAGWNERVCVECGADEYDAPVYAETSWQYPGWGDCNLTIRPDGEVWMIADSASGTDGTYIWKTRDGDGPKLLSDLDVKIPILWDNDQNKIY